MCVAPDQVIYVATDGDDGRLCGQLTPCKTIQHAVDIVGRPDEMRKIIRVRASATAYFEHLIIDGKAITIVGEGATVDGSSVGNRTIIVVRNGADVTVEGLRITGSGGSAPGPGVECQGTADQSSTLRLRRSTIAGNAGGGVSLSRCQFSIVNSIIVGNGASNSLFGGVDLGGVSSQGLYEIQFTTIYDNSAATDVVSGVFCGTVLVPLRFANNIVHGNVVRGTATQVGGDTDCKWAYSDIGPQAVTGAADGGNNINEPPSFVDISKGNFHLEPAWPHKNKADPAAAVNIDIDGDVRPQGGRSDMGADEVVAP